MAALKDLQATVHRVLRQELPVAEGARVLGADAARLDIYREFVEQHVKGILDKIYPMVRALVGPETWLALSDAYFREVPARSWELNDAARKFPEFLDARIARGDELLDPFLVALAQVEWEELATLLHPARLPDPATLQSPVVNPTTAALALRYAVIPFLVAHEDETELSPATPLPAPSDAPQYALLFRRANHKVSYYHGSDDLLFALKVVHEGVPLEAAADAAHQPLAVARAALDEAIRIGLVLAPA